MNQVQPFANLTDEEYEALKASIAEHGLLSPITKDQTGVVLDGNHRLRACRELGVQPRYEIVVCEGDDERYVRALVMNLLRRHLTREQKAEKVAELRARGWTYQQIADETGIPVTTAQRLATESPDVSQTENVGAESNGGSRTVIDSLGRVQPKMKAKAKPQPTVVPAKNDREEQRAVQALAAIDVQAGPHSVRDLEKLVRQEQKRDRSERLARQTEEAAVRLNATPTADAKPQPGQWWQLGRHRLYCGDSTNAEFIKAAEGAAFAFADPPYNAGKADWDQDFTWQHDYLTETAGIVAVTPGISAIQDFFAATAMPYRWSMAAWITNGMTRGALGFGNWIYLALFSHGESLHRNAQDVLRITIDTATTPETNHASRKPARLLVDLIDLFTDKGDTVVDPFLGSGTTLFAADQTGRTCIGAELDLTHCGEIIAKYGPEAQPL